MSPDRSVYAFLPGNLELYLLGFFAAPAARSMAVHPRVEVSPGAYCFPVSLMLLKESYQVFMRKTEEEEENMLNCKVPKLIVEHQFYIELLQRTKRF